MYVLPCYSEPSDAYPFPCSTSRVPPIKCDLCGPSWLLTHACPGGGWQQTGHRELEWGLHGSSLSPPLRPLESDWGSLYFFVLWAVKQTSWWKSCPSRTTGVSADGFLGWKRCSGIAQCCLGLAVKVFLNAQFSVSRTGRHSQAPLSALRSSSCATHRGTCRLVERQGAGAREVTIRKASRPRRRWSMS